MTTEEAYRKDAEACGKYLTSWWERRKLTQPSDDTAYYLARWAAHWS